MDTDIDATMLRLYVITRKKIGMTAARIIDELLRAWNNKALSSGTARRWINEYNFGKRQFFSDDIRCGHLSTSNTTTNLLTLQQLLETDPLLSIR